MYRLGFTVEQFHFYHKKWGIGGELTAEHGLVALADIQKDTNAEPVRHLLVGECKWKNNPIGLDVLVSLKDKASVLHGEPYYWLFSKRGFGFIEDNERVELIDLPMMYEL